MRISVIDASNYFRGLLLLIRKDRKTTRPEIELMQRVGRSLGFEREFCENAIDEILENVHIVDEPPSFSTKELAAMFVKDGLAIAFADDELDPEEDRWLVSTAERNGLDARFSREERESAGGRKGVPLRLEAEDLTMGNF